LSQLQEGRLLVGLEGIRSEAGRLFIKACVRLRAGCARRDRGGFILRARKALARSCICLARNGNLGLLREPLGLLDHLLSEYLRAPGLRRRVVTYGCTRWSRGEIQKHRAAGICFGLFREV